MTVEFLFTPPRQNISGAKHAAVVAKLGPAITV